MGLLDKLMIKYTQRQIKRNFYLGYGKESGNKSILIALLGTGGPINNKIRIAATGISVLSENVFLLFDCGSGVGRNADILRLPTRNLTKVFLTHFHSDHIADLGEVSFGSWVRGRNEPLEIYGPEKVQDIVEGYARAYSHDFAYRTLHHGEEIMPYNASKMIARPFSIPPRSETEKDPVKIQVCEEKEYKVWALEADHGPVRPAVSYCIEIRGKKIVILGDGNYHEYLTDFCKDADIIIANTISHEIAGIISEATREMGQFRYAKITKDICNYHMNPVQAATLAHDSNAKKLILIHVTPPIFNRIIKKRYIRGVKKIYDGPIVIGKDRMIIHLKS
ncbi:MAG: MBL fold metallo-hydrolase [Candidatus Lokiarchaeota archaeon]|nr:MBL fold metallo-hydrolase [Candidatus Lokiarchaeota archaeon]